MKWVRLSAVVIVLLVGCGGEERSARVMVLGLDGLDPTIVDLLMSEGKLPHFARLRREGAYGTLLSEKPLLSPVVWTSIATGKSPDQHRIGHFVAVDQTTGKQLPVTSQMRGTKAIWNILSEGGREVAVVGWWATWPPEKVRGAMVSDHLAYHFLFEEGFRPAAPGEATTFPPELEKELRRQVRRPQEITPAELSKFASVPAQEFTQPFDFQSELSHLRWALSAAQTNRNVGLKLWKEKEPDHLMVYIEGTDSVSHLFGHLFRAGTLAGELAEQQKRYGQVVEQMYVFADGVVGEFMDAMDEDTTLVVLSDHGFELGKLQDDPSKTRDMRRVSEQFHRLRGILYLYGHGVKSRARLERATIYDIAPTLLALHGLAPAADMRGRVLSEALTVPVKEPLPTYESGPAQIAQTARPDSKVDEEHLKRLQALGYIQTASPKGDRNLAAVLFEQKRYAEAVEAYRKLVAAQPADASLRASLAGALGASGKYDEALEELTASIKLDPINPEAYHNRAVIHERKGNRAAAIKDYQTAVRYAPQYQASQQALTRLEVTELPNAPRSEAEKRAFALAEEASQSARRGDYAAAMKTIDEAIRLAPRYGLLYQYRSNIAYLMGDRSAAIAALKKGLEVEPDNALFRENLRRIEQAKN